MTVQALSPLSVKPQNGGVHSHGSKSIAGGLLCKVYDATRVVNLHEAKGSRLLLVRWQSRHCDVGTGLAVLQEKVLVVHAVQVVACMQHQS